MQKVKRAAKGVSGRSLSQAERKAAGRPVVSVSLPELTVAQMDALSQHLSANRSRIVTVAVAQLYARELGKRAPWEVIGALKLSGSGEGSK
jgi:hypothetical protein